MRGNASGGQRALPFGIPSRWGPPGGSTIPREGGQERLFVLFGVGGIIIKRGAVAVLAEGTNEALALGRGHESDKARRQFRGRLAPVLMAQGVVGVDELFVPEKSTLSLGMSLFSATQVLLSVMK